MQPPVAADTHAEYEAYAIGVPVASMRTGFAIQPGGYRVALAFHTTGLVGALFRGHQASRADGVWEGGRAEPLHYAGDGVWRGQQREVVIDYRAGQPLIRALVPPNDDEREPVPPQLQANSVDTLSALALLMRKVAQTGRCEAEVVTYDGRRAVDVAARTGPMEQLAREGRSSFAGPALRCDFEGRMLAGFMKDADADDRAALARAQHGSAWFAQVVPGAPPLPVRITFETRWFGHTTMYLTGAGPGPAAPASD